MGAVSRNLPISDLTSSEEWRHEILPSNFRHSLTLKVRNAVRIASAEAGAMDRWVIPRARKMGRACGSDAISPHTVTVFPASRAAAVMRIRAWAWAGGNGWE